MGLDSPPAEIRLSLDLLEAMMQAVDALAPEEACGLVGGLEGTATRIFQIENYLHSPVRYEMAPEQALEALISIDNEGEELLAIFHSHPNGPAFPSPTDIREANYPEAGHIIWFRSSGNWECRGYVIQEGEFNEISVIITP